ncbi:MAG: GDSL-type esterase/lipase family protein [Steroidobacteraceae bacterium]|nr:GDSL-type esterase/lipase family protein [Steroidobacteraceae bacterium]
MRACSLPLIVILLALAGAAVAQSISLTRFEDQVRAYESADRTDPPPRNAVVAVGSSTIRLWNTIATDLAPIAPVLERGFGGSTAVELEYYLDRLVLVYAPRAVLIYTGENDVASGFTPRQIADTMRLILVRIRTQQPGARRYVVSIKPSILRWSQWERARQANALLKALCAEGLCRYIDAATGLLGADGRPRPDYYATDQLHLSAAGYAAWTKAIKPALLADESRRPKPPDNLRIGTG